MQYIRTTLVDASTEEWIMRNFAGRAGRFPHIFSGAEERIRALDTACGEKDPAAVQALKLALYYLYAVMPLSDAAGYPFETFADFAEQGVRLRLFVQKAAALPDELYLPYVLCHRVNEEEIRPCRKLFYARICRGRESVGDSAAELTGSADEKQDILAVNLWCAENGTYHSDDERTISSLAFYERGYGRCGEESAFAVNALRAVGIPARQVYVPRWAHCDDNHAWVEAWADGAWHFLGACEPQPVLDLGWFNHAASRAMLVHARWFGDYVSFMEAAGGKCAEDVIGREGIVTVLNETGRYAETVRLHIRAKDPDGRPCAGALIRVKILNAAEFVTIAELVSDKDGRAEITLGKGSVRLDVKGYPGSETDIYTGKTQEVSLCCRKDAEEEGRLCGMHRAPRESSMNPDRTTKKERELNRAQLAAAKARLQIKTDSYHNPAVPAARKELQSIGEKEPGKEEREKLLDDLLSVLSAKDLTDCSKEVLLDAVLNVTGDVTAYVQGRTITEERSPKESGENETASAAEEIFRRYLLNPRVEYEVLAPDRKWLQERYAERAASIRQDPEQFWQDLACVQSCPGEERASVPERAEAVAAYGVGSTRAKKILFVKTLRALGIPARLHPVTGELQYCLQGAVESAPGQEAESAAGSAWRDVETENRAALVTEGSCGMRTHTYHADWTVSVWDPETEDFRTLNATDAWDTETETGREEAGAPVYSLRPGRVRILTSLRLPDGDCRFIQRDLLLHEEERRRELLEFPEADPSEMFYRTDLPDFTLRREDKEGHLVPVEGSALTDGESRILLWLEVSGEPTEHILNELYAAGDLFRPIAGKICFILRSPEDKKNALFTKVQQALPGSSILYDDGSVNPELLGRKMYIDFENLPMIILTDGALTGMYATAGYNVGTAELLLRLLQLNSAECRK